jgi:predicted XRE-type DNA-binding protein
MELELKQGLLAAYRRLLRPLIRILLRNGVAFGEFAEVAKEVYVDVAAKDFKVPHRKMSQARIAILTGLTRKEVSRFYGDKKTQGKEEQKNNVNRVTRVLTGWHTDTEFSGPYGLPLELEFEGRNGSDFCSLVQHYSGDMAARAMLDELLRIGAVKETESGWYKVLTRTYLPDTDAPASLDLLGTEVQRFISTIDHNIREQDSDKRNFERHVHADEGIKAQDLPRLRAFIKSRAQLLLEEVDNWLSQLDKPDLKKDEIVHTGLGIFHYIEEDEEENKN